MPCFLHICRFVASATCQRAAAILHAGEDSVTAERRAAVKHTPAATVAFMTVTPHGAFKISGSPALAAFPHIVQEVQQSFQTMHAANNQNTRRHFEQHGTMPLLTHESVLPGSGHASLVHIHQSPVPLIQKQISKAIADAFGTAAPHLPGNIQCSEPLIEALQAHGTQLDRVACWLFHCALR